MPSYVEYNKTILWTSVLRMPSYAAEYATMRGVETGVVQCSRSTA